MFKKLFIISAILACAACAGTNSKTPQTDRGQLNSCMLSRAYTLKSSDELFKKDKWTTSREILNYCKRKLNFYDPYVSETQSLNIVASYIETLK